MYTLGINAAFHDSAACIFKDGILLAAAEEERFTHIKHGKRPVPFSAWELPFHAIDYCLQVAGVHLSDVDHVAYAFDPYLLIPDHVKGEKAIAIPFETQDGAQDEWLNPWDPLWLSSILHAKEQLVDGYPHHLQQRLGGAKVCDFEWHYVEHHVAHAASAYLPSPYSEAAIMTLDGRGELATTTYNVGRGNDIGRLAQVNMPHSLGLLYERLTTHLGFLHSSDEYKVMALASYGKPVFANDFRDIITIGKDGQYTVTCENLEERFGEARLKNADFTDHHFNIARSLQLVLEEAVLELARWLHHQTGLDHLCLAGGIALNCVVNAKLRDQGPFKDIWVQPAAGDSGTALGAAQWIDHAVRRKAGKQFVMEHVYWGPDYGDEEIEGFLKWVKVPYRKLVHVAEETAAILAQNKIIGWYKGRMEFGPRALGSRSILASPIDPTMQARLNEVKDREDFRPVAPVVLEEDAAEWFEGATSSPFMLFVHQVKQDKVDRIPAVRHIDGTARIQTVNAKQHPAYYDLIRAFKAKTGVPVLVNTSFNTLGKPIVCSPRDAIACFWTSPFDALVIGSFIVEK